MAIFSCSTFFNSHYKRTTMFIKKYIHVHSIRCKFYLNEIIIDDFISVFNVLNLTLKYSYLKSLNIRCIRHIGGRNAFININGKELVDKIKTHKSYLKFSKTDTWNAFYYFWRRCIDIIFKKINIYVEIILSNIA